MNNNKLQGKDFITCGIFSLLGMVGMVLAAVMNISGYPRSKRSGYIYARR